MSISVKVKIHSTGDTFFAREGTYEKNKNGKMVPGYYLITPLGDRWIPCSECGAISLNGYSITKGAPSENSNKDRIASNGRRKTVKSSVRKGTSRGNTRRIEKGSHLPPGGD